MTRVLITGSGKSGSWQIRGVQLGAAIGATVLPDADAKTIAAHDVVVLVKRPPTGLIQRLHASGVPMVYDIVDAWPQPAGNSWGYEACIRWMRAQLDIVRPQALVAATRAMAADLTYTRLPVLALPHHARPGLALNPLRHDVSVVGYEGGVAHLGAWQDVVREECQTRGWRFVLNPPSLTDLDIVVALRDRQGYAATHWKSGVKLSNAQASGTPFVGAREAGYLEQAIGNCEKWATSPRSLALAFDELTPLEERERVARWMRTAAPSLPAVAATYLEWLQGLPCLKAPKF